jgi:predicted MPP superfamily phosphohydrolase
VGPVATGELRSGYDDLWAVSDVHGRLLEFEALLLAARLCVREGGEVRWDPANRQQLLVLVGDLIDGGPESRGVVGLVQTLQAQAAGAGSRVVVFLGNHDLAYLRRHPRAKILAIGLGRTCWENELEGGARARVGRGPQTAPVGLDDRPADRGGRAGRVEREV